MAQTVVLGLGSNVCDAPRQIAEAVEALEAVLSQIQVSHIYITQPVGGVGDAYHNAVVIAKSALVTDQLCAWCKRYERQAGRTDESRACGDVPIDIDVVMADNRVLRPKDFSQQYFRIGYDALITKV